MKKHSFMKKILLVFFVLTIQTLKANSIDTLKVNLNPPLLLEDCDACGSSASGGGSGFGSLLDANFIGIRYLNQNYATKSGSFGNSPWATDVFNTTTLQARISVFKKISLSAQFSYHNNQRRLTTLKQVNADQHIYGVGDGVVLGFYNLFNSMENDSVLITQKINTGAGVKLPLGEFTPANSDGNNPAFQLGTGSWDYIIALEYLLKFNKIGLNTLVNYTYKTVNKDAYKFGNQLNYSTTVFYALDKTAVQFFPQIGVQGETYQNNELKEKSIKNTEGNIMFGKLGLEISYTQWSLGVNYFKPISQQLMGGNLVANERFSVQLNFSL